ncbi:hypothetical protein TNCV_1847941 [Trichonephila clavipes]|nr:hypothetical protein TNCV_1847941 [Trichonephila clavipes]
MHLQIQKIYYSDAIPKSLVTDDTAKRVVYNGGTLTKSCLINKWKNVMLLRIVFHTFPYNRMGVMFVEYIHKRMIMIISLKMSSMEVKWLQFNELDDVVKNLLWPAQSSDLNVIETLWSIFERSIQNRYLPLASPEQLLQYLHEECYNSHLNKVLEFHELIPM